MAPINRVTTTVPKPLTSSQKKHLADVKSCREANTSQLGSTLNQTYESEQFEYAKKVFYAIDGTPIEDNKIHITNWEEVRKRLTEGYQALRDGKEVRKRLGDGEINIKDIREVRKRLADGKINLKQLYPDVEPEKAKKNFTQWVDFFENKALPCYGNKQTGYLSYNGNGTHLIQMVRTNLAWSPPLVEKDKQDLEKQYRFCLKNQ